MAAHETGAMVPGGWKDTHFADTEGIVAVFDFDYEAIIDFQWQVKLCEYATCPLVPVLASLNCEPCFAKQNIEWQTNAMHVAVHEDVRTGAHTIFTWPQLDGQGYP